MQYRLNRSHKRGHEIDIAESAEAWLRYRKTEIAEQERDDILQSLMAAMDSFAIQAEPLTQEGS